MRVRDATAADSPAILALNDAWVHFLSPLDAQRLALLVSLSAYYRVVEDDDGEILGFLLGFRENTTYDSPNYGWFTQRYETFFYVDRVVVAAAAQGRGVGRLLYDDFFATAKAAHVSVVAAEYYTVPPNPVSQRFHDRYGFHEVGTQWIEGGTKRVSLQVATP